MTLVFKLFLIVSLYGICSTETETETESPTKSKIPIVSNVTTSCPTCDLDYCPKSAQECSHGLVKDECGCCKEGVCLLHEKEKCLNLKLYKNITDTEMKKYSVCGEYSKCVLRSDVKAGEIQESVCECQKMEVSCGKDNETYHSMCHLKEANTELKHPGACKTSPVIVSNPEVISSLEHESFSLNCEAKGFPVPNIHWEFEGLNGLFKLLPGDDPSIAVHNRGGPEPFTVSSWVLIESLRQSDAGTYICIVRNSEGEARAVASVHVTKKNSKASEK